MKTKPRVIKDFESVDQTIIEQIKMKYPMGFSKHLVNFVDLKGKKVSALPFETEEKSYMLKITKDRAKHIMLNGAESQVFDLVEKEDLEKENPVDAKVKKIKEIQVNEPIED